jgi:uncharacterized protein (DUF2141 family)
MTLLLLGLVAVPAAAAELVVEVEGVRSAAGNIRAGLFDGAASWLEGERALRRVAVEASAPRTVLRFGDLAPGRYAVAFYHDENHDQRHDRNLLGMPLEGFGFTRDPTVVLTPPSFEECAVEVPGEGARVGARVKY